MAATDILTLPEAKRAINISADSVPHEEELEMVVSGLSARIDDLCGPVVARTTTEVHDGGQRWIWPHKAPVLSVTSVTEFDGTTQTVLTDESAFGTVGGSVGFALVDAYRIERRSGSRPYRFGAGQVQVVYEAGRFATTADVSPKFKTAAASILRRLWKREGSAWAFSADFFANTDEAAVASPFFRAVDPMVEEFLGSELRLPAIA